SHAEFDYLPPLEFEQVSLPQQVALHFVAEATGSTERLLRELNPELIRRLTPPASKQQPYRLRVPAGTAHLLRDRLRSASRAEQLSARVHRVRRGDSLYRLARRYRTHPRVLREVNGLKPKAPLLLNARLLVPRLPRIVAVDGQLSGPTPSDTRAQTQALEVRAASQAAGMPLASAQPLPLLPLRAACERETCVVGPGHAMTGCRLMRPLPLPPTTSLARPAHAARASYL